MSKKSLDVTSTQWDQYEKKFGGLMNKITRHISGDNVLTNPEDSYAELCLAAITSINGFHNLTGKSFDEMWEDPMFTKYTKTCLWHSKNNRGARISKRMPMLRKMFSIQHHHVDQQVYTDETFSNLYIDDLRVKLSDKEAEVLDMILESSDYLTSRGKVNVRALSRALKCSWVSAKKLVTGISIALGSDL